MSKSILSYAVKATCFISTAIFLSACGGGGGGGSVPVVSLTELSKTSSGQDLSGGTLSSQRSGVSSSGNTITVNGTTTTKDSARSTDGVLTVYGDGDAGAYVADTLTNARFGIGGDGDTLSAFHFGNKTTASQMPTNVTANYSGGFLGVQATADDNTTGVVAGDANVSANFSANSVNGSITNMQVINNGSMTSTGYGVNMNGTISGNTYSGTATTTNTTVLGNGTGTMEGAFYGANAAETAGTVGIMGEDGSLVGSFGAAK